MFYVCFFFFFNDTATTEIYTLSLHDALPISSDRVASLGRPNQVVPPSTNSNSALSAAPLLVRPRSEEHTSELQSPCNIVCRLLLEKKEDKERIQVFSGTVIMKKGAGINQTFT